MEPDDFCKKMPKSSQGKTTFPCDGDAVYPFVNLQFVSSRHRLQSRITLTVLKKVRSFFIVQRGGTTKNAKPAL